MLNIMIDIETLATSQDAAIIEIGMASFCGKLQFSKAISIYSNLVGGRKISEETLRWWEDKVDPEVKNKLFHSETTTLRYALVYFAEILRLKKLEVKEINFWANGASFDFPILEHAYKSLDIDVPWEYYQLRDYRTLKNLFPQISKEKNDKPHSALDDALAQAKHAQRILDYLKCGHVVLV